jgi:apolipoprotein N-acyltransferase
MPARRCAVALGGGLLLPLAFAPFGLWPLAMVSLAVLLWTLRDVSPGRAAAIGWCYGAGMFGLGVWWIQVSVHQFGVPYYAFSVPVTALFIAGMACYPALFAWGLRRLPGPRGTVRLLVLAPALWVLVEWLRGILFTGFPWLSLGYSQLHSPLAGLAPVLGVPGISLAVSFVAAAGVAALTVGHRARLLLTAGVLLVFAAGGALGTVAWTRPIETGLEVALVQGAIPQHLKWQRELRERSLAHYRALTAPHWDADVIIWPETAIPAFPIDMPEEMAALQHEAAAAGTALLVGMPTGEPAGGRYYNSVVAFGRVPGQYDKRHLVPFGEFFPFPTLMRNLSLLLSIPLSDFSAGAANEVTLAAAGHRAGISICYEDAFARDVMAALPEAAFLVNVSNDAWFGDTIAPHQHLEIARMRALESGRYLLRGTNTGVSAVIDPHGAVVARAPQFEATVLRARFAAHAGVTPYVALGDGPLLLLLVLAVAGALVHARRRAPAARPDPVASGGR